MKTLVVLLGPTGIGKTDLSISLAKEMGCPILNCDSRQLFRDLQIGTAAPTPEQLAQVKHYFVGTLALDEYYSAAQYEADALRLLEELFQTHDTILLSGGSMMYIDAVCKGIDDIPTIDEQTRTLMKQRLEQEGLEALVAELKELDPAYYAIADHKNTRRIVHALEICHMTGKTYTSFRTQQAKKRPFNILKIGLQRPREELFDRINQRVEQMMQDGLLEEVQQFRDQRHLNALNTVGYKEINEYLDIEEMLQKANLSQLEHKAQVEALRSQGKLPTLTDAKERIKKNTRVYAKKQMTWFAKDDTIHWFHPSQTADIRQTIIACCKEARQTPITPK